MTNRDRIRAMKDEDLAFVLMCPYDTTGEPENIMPCVDKPPSVKNCCDCIKDWLQKEAKEEQ